MDISAQQLSWSELKAFIDSLALIPLMKASWSELKNIAELMGVLLVAIAAILAIRKLPRIFDVLKQYQENKSSILELHSSVTNLEKLMPNLQEAASTLDAALPRIDARLEALNERLVALQEQADERSRLEEAAIYQTVDPKNTRNDQESIAEKWREFSEAVRAKLPDADLRSVGEIGSRLMDRRRNNPISLEDAKLIAAIGTQHNRFKRVTPTGDEVAYFNAAVDRAVQKISKVGQRSAVKTNGGNTTLAMQ
jgi:hypothetical protein